MYLHVLSFLDIEALVQCLKYSSLEDKDLPMLYIQWNDLWSPGDARQQGISDDGIDLGG